MNGYHRDGVLEMIGVYWAIECGTNMIFSTASWSNNQNEWHTRLQGRPGTNGRRIGVDFFSPACYISRNGRTREDGTGYCVLRGVCLAFE